jgi:micrococcal nuclease
MAGKTLHMKLPKLVLSLLFLVSIAVNAVFLSQKYETTRVVSVQDGDSFTLKNGERVRLIGVDTPEKDMCLSDKAKAKLTELIQGKRVMLKETKPDAFGRTMALVYVNGNLVNAELLRLGLAKLDYTPNSQAELFKELSKVAKERHWGVFSDTCKSINPTPTDPKCVIKSNIDLATGKRYYHLPKCRHYGQIVLDADRGERFYCTEKEAVADGFGLAPDCLR